MDLYLSFSGFVELIASPVEIIVDDNIFGEHPWLKLLIEPVFLYGSLPRPPDLQFTVVCMCLLPLLFKPVASEKFIVGDLVEKMRISEARYAHREGEIWLNSYKEFVSSGSVLRQGETVSNRTNILGILIHNNGEYDFEVLWSHCVCEVDINMLLSLSLFVKTEDGCSVSFNTLLCVDLLYNLSLRHGLQGFDILIQKMELTSEKCYFLLDWFCPAMFNSHIPAHMQRMERRFQLVDDVDQVLVLFPMMSQLLFGKLRMSLVQPLDSPV